MKTIKRVNAQLASDSSINTTVISIGQYQKGYEYTNNEHKIDLIAYDGSLYVFGGYGTRIYNVDDPTQEGDFICIVRKGETGAQGPRGRDGATPEAPEIHARFEGGKLTVYSEQNGTQRRETISPDLTGPSWRPTVEDGILSWERSWDKSTPNSINLEDLRPTSEHPILLRTNSDNTKRSDETSGPANFIQWKYEGQEEWTNLISISDLMNLALAGVSVWFDEEDGKYHFGHKRVNKASYDVGKKGGQIISAVDLDDEEILYDAGPLPFALSTELNEVILDIDRIDGLICDLQDQINETNLRIPDVSDCIRGPLKTINGETLLGSGNIVIPVVDSTSDLVNDSGFITMADVPTIPENVSAFNNDAGYITESALDGYLTNADLEGLVSESDLRTINGESLLKGSGVSDDLKIYSLGNVTASASYGDNLGVTVTPTINGSTKDLHFAFTFPNAAPVAQDSTLTITTDPSDAEISINDEVVGTGSYVYEGKIGDVIQVKVTRNAYFTYNEPITLTEAEQSLPITIEKHATTWEFGNNNGTPIRTARFAYNDGINEAKTIYVKTNTGITITRPSTFDNYFVLEDENGNPVANHYDAINEMKEWKIYPKQENLNDVDVEMTLKYTCDRMDEHTSGGSATLNIFQSPAPALDEATLAITATPRSASISINDQVVGTGSYTYSGHAGDSVEVKVSKDGYFTKTQNYVLEAGENTADISLTVHSLIFTTNSGSSASIHSIAFDATDDSSVSKTVNVHSNTQYTLSRSDNFNTYFNLYTSSSYSAGTPVAVADGVYDTSSTNRDYVIVPKSANTSQEEISTFLKVTCNRTAEHVNDGGYESTLTVTQAAGEPIIEPSKGNIQFNVSPTDATLKVGNSASSLSAVTLSNGSYTVVDRLVLQPLYYEASKSGYVSQSGNVSAIENDTKVVDINLVENIALSTAPNTLSFGASDTTSKSSTVYATSTGFKITAIPSWVNVEYKATENGIVVNKSVSIGDEFDGNKTFYIVPNSNNTSSEQRSDNIVAVSTINSSVTTSITIVQVGTTVNTYTYTVLPKNSWDSLIVRKVVIDDDIRHGETIQPSTSTNIFTLNEGDQIYASATRNGYYDVNDGQLGQPITMTENRTWTIEWEAVNPQLRLANASDGWNDGGVGTFGDPANETFRNSNLTYEIESGNPNAGNGDDSGGDFNGGQAAGNTGSSSSIVDGDEIFGNLFVGKVLDVQERNYRIDWEILNATESDNGGSPVYTASTAADWLHIYDSSDSERTKITSTNIAGMANPSWSSTTEDCLNLSINVNYGAARIAVVNIKLYDSNDNELRTYNNALVIKQESGI